VDRPPADPTKLLAALGEWESGEVPAGRTMGNLKTGGFRELLEHLAASGDGAGPSAGDVPVADLLGSWMEWETGATPPGEVLAALHAAGLRVLLTSLVAPAG
jgi:hypothetical protein